MPKRRTRAAPVKTGRRPQRVSKLELVSTAVHNARVTHRNVYGSKAISLSQLIVTYNLAAKLQMSAPRIVVYMRLVDEITEKMNKNHN